MGNTPEPAGGAVVEEREGSRAVRGMVEGNDMAMKSLKVMMSTRERVKWRLLFDSFESVTTRDSFRPLPKSTTII